LRLFLEDSETFEEFVPDLQTGVPICIPAHSACLTIDQWSTHLIAFRFLPLRVACNWSTASCTRATGILWAYPTGENTSIIGLVLGKPENEAFHPEGPFAIRPSAVLAFARLEVAKVLKDENACLMGCRKLDNAAGD
jgi:hypothetical protein